MQKRTTTTNKLQWASKVADQSTLNLKNRITNMLMNQPHFRGLEVQCPLNIFCLHVHKLQTCSYFISTTNFCLLQTAFDTIWFGIVPRQNIERPEKVRMEKAKDQYMHRENK